MNGEGAPHGAAQSSGWAHGIYLDDRTHHIQVDSNTTVNNQLGIFLHNNRYHTVFDNVCYGNREAQIQIQRDGIVDGTVYGNQVYRNAFFSTGGSQATIKQARMVTNDSALAHLSDNIECAETPFGIECKKEGKVLWSQTYVDLRSTMVGPNKISNGDFDSSVLGWSAWPGEYFTLTVDHNASPDKNCLRVRYANDPETRGPIFMANRTYLLQQGKLYRLAFSAKENHAGSMEVTARLANSPWTTNGLTTSVILDTAWNNFELFFTPTATDSACRVDFYMSESDSLIWIDNVSLHDINDNGLPRELRSRLFHNGTLTTKTFPLGADTWRAPDGTRGIRGSVSLGSFLSRVLVKDSIGAVSIGHGALSGGVPQSYRICALRNGTARIRINGPLPARVSLTLRTLNGKQVAKQVFTGTTVRRVLDVHLTKESSAGGIHLLTVSDPTGSVTMPVVQPRLGEPT